MAELFSAISFDNEIRGLLVVLLGAAILIGSVWLIVSTNTGFRLGTLIILAAVFGWTTIMAFVWALYGIGLQGARPTWDVVAVHIESPDELDVSTRPTGVLRDLPTPIRCDTLGETDCLPRAAQLVGASDNSEARGELGIETLTDPEKLNESLSVLLADVEAVNAFQLREQDEEGYMDYTELLTTAAVTDLTLSELEGVAPELVEEADANGWLELGGWQLQSSQAAGEAVTAATAYLIEAGLGFDEDSDFVVKDAFQQGGKPARLNNGVWERVSNKVLTSAMLRHPTNYTVVQVQESLDLKAVPGEAPPPALSDPDAPLVSVLMERNLGRFRLPSILITIGSGLLFVATLLMLHTRDLEVRRRLSDPATG